MRYIQHQSLLNFLLFSLIFLNSMFQNFASQIFEFVFCLIYCGLCLAMGLFWLCKARVLKSSAPYTTNFDAGLETLQVTFLSNCINVQLLATFLLTAQQLMLSLVQKLCTFSKQVWYAEIALKYSLIRLILKKNALSS